MNTRTLLIATIVPALTWGTSTRAQDEPKRPASETRPAAGVYVKDAMCLLKGTDVIGAKVKNPQGEDLGKIEELVLDPTEGTIEYAVLSFGGFLGMGDKLFALPFSLLNLPGKNEGSATDRKRGNEPRQDGAKPSEASVPKEHRKPAHFVLDVDKERLKKASGFPKDNWPDIHSGDWRSEIDKYYGVPARTRTTNDPGQAIDSNKQYKICKVSELNGKDIFNSAGDKVGDTKDLVVDLGRGQVHYVVVSTGRALGTTSKYLAVPWKALKHMKDGETDKCVLDMTKERLEKAPEYKDSEWAKMSDPAWCRELYAYYGVRQPPTDMSSEAGGKKQKPKD
jgi:sporulation protein YlmC with PRC-barrel domain